MLKNTIHTILIEILKEHGPLQVSSIYRIFEQKQFNNNRNWKNSLKNSPCRLKRRFLKNARSTVIGIIMKSVIIKNEGIVGL